jgi:beta-phosphoglucomutase
MKPKAFIFDLDGVLTDTANYHYLAWKDLADELNFTFDRNDNERLKGVSRIRSFEIILEINGCSDKYSEQEKEYYANKKNDRYVELISEITPNDVLPNIIRFLDEAKAAGIKLAVASASKNAAKVLSSLEIEHYFDFIADASKIVNSKPDPEVFNVCCDKLCLNNKECIGFEDAQAGIEAIRDAGMFSVGINVEVTSHAPDLALKSTEELDLVKIITAYEVYNK